MRVEIDAAKVDETFAEITRNFQREARLPGFRPGKAPKDMVAKRYETEIQDEAKRKIISDSYRQAVAEQKLNVIGPPDIEEIEFARGQKCQFAATLEIAPEFQLPEYKGLLARRETGGVTPEDIERALRLLGERQTQFQTVTRELKEGDVAVVNYTGSCDGKPITDTAPAAKGLAEKKSFWINVDKTSFIPGFGDQLIGMKAGDKRTVTVDFPADFVTPQLAGKKGVYEVELVEAKEKVAPEFNDDFAKSYGADNMEKLREGVRADLQNEWNLKQSRSIRNQVWCKISWAKSSAVCPSPCLNRRRGKLFIRLSTRTSSAAFPRRRSTRKRTRFTPRPATRPGNASRRPSPSSVWRKRKACASNNRTSPGACRTWRPNIKCRWKSWSRNWKRAAAWAEVYSQLLNEKVVDLLVQYAKLEDVAPTAAVPA